VVEPLGLDPPLEAAEGHIDRFAFLDDDFRQVILGCDCRCVCSIELGKPGRFRPGEKRER